MITVVEIVFLLAFLKYPKGKYFPSHQSDFLFVSFPSSAFLGGNLNYDAEFFVLAWFVRISPGRDPTHMRRNLFNFLTGESLSNVIQFPVAKKKVMVQGEGGHESVLNCCQKPWRLIQFFIEHFTVPGDAVLDLCSGSGTTAVTCYLSNRDCTFFSYMCFLLMREQYPH
jgi:hypothetical protein